MDIEGLDPVYDLGGLDPQGGAGSGGQGSFDDPPMTAVGSSDHPLAIIGQLDIDLGGVIHSLDGASNINGNIVLAGQASLSRPHVFGTQFTVYPFSIRLMGLDGEGRRVSALS